MIPPTNVVGIAPAVTEVFSFTARDVAGTLPHAGTSKVGVPSGPGTLTRRRDHLILTRLYDNFRRDLHVNSIHRVEG